MHDPTGRSYGYDAEERMAGTCAAGEVPCPNVWGVSLQREVYMYDGAGRRVREDKKDGSWTIFAYDAAGELSAESTTVVTGITGTRYLTEDSLGSVRMTTDAAGIPRDRHDYQPYGLEMGVYSESQRSGVIGYPGSGDNDTNHLFTAKERDAETGLDYFGARYMSSAQGRFTSPDPKQFPHDITDPQSWNKYSYTRNDPLIFVDPDGKDFGLPSWSEIKEQFNRNVGALFQPVSSPEAVTNPQVSGSSTGPGMDEHETALRFTQDLGKNLDKVSDVYNALDPTGVGSMAKSAMMGDRTGTVLAALPILAFGGRGGAGSITLSEAKSLVGGWTQATFDSVGKSIAYHFEEHGAEVGAGNIWQYLRKAEGFMNNLKGAAKKVLDDGKVRYEKKGYYIILDDAKKIVSYGTVN